ncbi:methyl-accepting chemotaxis protein [Desulfitobacterium sp. THU1]|uniref:methyl-accepting chemotaxis protein n=1 Tax=Desulfitobacterium sp. THU1 TaxID=3138072 RepID=UPI0031201661
MKKDNLNRIAETLPFLAEIFVEPTSISVSDYIDFTVLKSVPHPQLPSPVKEGDQLPEAFRESQTFKTIMSGQRVHVRLPIGAYGLSFPIISITIPIYDDDQQQVIGSLGVMTSTEKTDNLIHIGQEIMATLQQLYATADSLTTKGQVLSDMSNRMNLEIMMLKEDTIDIGNISDEIKKISSLTNILGINAAIESARVGEQGRGFKVVAEEVRKLAAGTKSSVTDIDNRIRKVQDEVNSITEAIRELDLFMKGQALGMSELRNALEHISTMAQGLVSKETLAEGGKKA